MPYEYNSTEQILMAIITGISNFSSIPVSLLTKKQKNTFVFNMAIFSMITSVLYHVCESLDIILFLPQKKWHELDNIGAICCMNSLILGFTSADSSIDEHTRLNYISIFIALIFQQRNPWDIVNTISPICLFILYCFWDWYKNGFPFCNRDALIYGSVYMVMAIAMFIQGLDDLNDYLRCYHSLWHLLIGLSTFYLWQVQEKKICSLKDILMNSYCILFSDS